jgi:hypothetical protein
MLDQSTLTGESVAVQIPEGKTAYVGTLVRGGEAIGEQSADRAMTSNGSEGHSGWSCWNKCPIAHVTTFPPLQTM